MSTGTNRIITPLIVVFILATTAPTFAGQIIYVDDDAPADFNNIQTAINYSNDGDVVIVAQGRYFENINFNGRNITLTSTDPCSPDVVAATIIDGSRNGSVVTFNSGEDANCVLKGFTITNGNAEHGGGIYCGWPPRPPGPHPPPPPPPPPSGTLIEQSSPEILSETNLTAPTIKNCIISNNSAGKGGGMYNIRSRSTITNCIVTGNKARHRGGGIHCEESSPTINSCIIAKNLSNTYGGGIYCVKSSPILTNCTISDNKAFGYSGGGICLGSSNPIISNCTFSENSARLEGGGICLWSSDPIIVNCIIMSNSAYNSYATGGGISCWASNPMITNCTIASNWAGNDGGGISCGYESRPTITQCTIADNSANKYGGGGMYNGGGSRPMVSNCIFWENIVDSSTGESAQIIGVPIINYCCIQGWTGTLGGTGNMGADPCLVDLGYWDSNDTPQDPRDDVWIEGDYHLLPDSPCINTGDPNYVAGAKEKDLDGKPRVIGCRIDMGAYEYGQLVPAEARIVPRTINLANQGKWITCYIYLPEAYK